MYILIIGGGKVGFYLAKELLKGHHTVSIVEKDQKTCEEVAKELDDVLLINGDGCNPRFLEDAGVSRANVVASVTGSDEVNLMVCQLAKQFSNVKRTVARVNDPKNTHTFNEVGVDVAVDSTSIIAKIIEEEVSLEDLVTLMTFKRGKLALVRVDLTVESPCVNKQVLDIKLPRASVLVSIIRGDDVIIPRGETVLQAKDDVIALTAIENEQDLLDALIGKVPKTS
ncbi:MAG: NAD-binding protein [Candidatus Omnitrophica bacterium]|nr:NAD-binding protein [Candidatus Omnitrophota bacterium]